MPSYFTNQILTEIFAERVKITGSLCFLESMDSKTDITILHIIQFISLRNNSLPEQTNETHSS